MAVARAHLASAEELDYLVQERGRNRAKRYLISDDRGLVRRTIMQECPDEDSLYRKGVLWCTDQRSVEVTSRSLGQRWRVIRGRNQDNCIHPEEAAALARFAYDVFRELCRPCNNLSGCRFLAQNNDGVKLAIGPMATLIWKYPPGAKLIVIDGPVPTKRDVKFSEDQLHEAEGDALLPQYAQPIVAALRVLEISRKRRLEGREFFAEYRKHVGDFFDRFANLRPSSGFTWYSRTRMSPGGRRAERRLYNYALLVDALREGLNEYNLGVSDSRLIADGEAIVVKGESMIERLGWLAGRSVLLLAGPWLKHWINVLGGLGASHLEGVTRPIRRPDRTLQLLGGLVETANAALDAGEALNMSQLARRAGVSKSRVTRYQREIAKAVAGWWAPGPRGSLILKRLPRETVTVSQRKTKHIYPYG